MFKTIFTLLFASLFLASCASSTPDTDSTAATSQEDARQKELDEIEALLGVEKPADDKSKTQKKAKEDDTLGLLSSEDVPLKGQAQTAQSTPSPDLQKEVKDLKSQLAQKDEQITDLQRQVKNQNIQISQLETSKSSVPATSSYQSMSGDIAPGEYSQRYQEGFSLFQSRNYRGAIEVFEALLASDANNSLSDNAQYWIGESHYALGQYKAAIIDFEKVFTFPKSNKNPDAQFKLGLCYVRLGEKDKAREEFQRLLDLYPKSEYVNRAQQHLAEL
jgi:tol-pal system protein YbgF